MADPRSYVGYEEGEDWGQSEHVEAKAQNRVVRDGLDAAIADAEGAVEAAGAAIGALKGTRAMFNAACARCNELPRVRDGASGDHPEIDLFGLLAVAASRHVNRLRFNRTMGDAERRAAAAAAIAHDLFPDWPIETVERAVREARPFISKQEAARLVGVTWDVKENLDLSTFGACDLSEEEYASREVRWLKDKAKERQKRCREKKKAMKKLLPPKVREPDPWVLMGVSRSTYFRQKAAEAAKNLSSDVAMRVLAAIKSGPATAATVAAACDLKVATVRSVLAAAEEHGLVRRFGRGIYRIAETDAASPTPVQPDQPEAARGVSPGRRAEIARAMSRFPRRVDEMRVVAARALAGFRLPVVNLPPDRSPPPRRRSA